MKVLCIDTKTRRSDHKGCFSRFSSRPVDITKNSVYEVLEVLDGKYLLINNEFKATKHSQFRFEVVDDSPINNMTSNYNVLTRDLRMERNKLLKELKELKKI